MSGRLASTKERIVEAADRLFYEEGFESASIGDIAGAVGISRGNLTFHFATKDEVLEAVIDRRLERTRGLLDGWEKNGTTPAERIGSFIEILIMNRTKILRHGCPVGTLCSELAKLDHGLLGRANELFTLFKDWLSRQFAQMGCGPRSDALALHLLARSQGIATLANAFHDEAFLREEVRGLHGWLAGFFPERREGGRSRRRPRRDGTLS
jgi:TetR/AcrR family transcriptional repressor of nem operon